MYVKRTKNGVNIWALVRKTCAICVVVLELLGFTMGSTFDVNCDLALALRRQIFEYLRETFYRHALEYLKPARAEKSGGKSHLPTDTPV